MVFLGLGLLARHQLHPAALEETRSLNVSLPASLTQVGSEVVSICFQYASPVHIHHVYTQQRDPNSLSANRCCPPRRQQRGMGT